mgnify:CR=1 FL=1
MISPLPVQWVPRSTPLEPVAALAFGPVAIRMGQRILETGTGSLRGLGAGDHLFVTGPPELLPWVDGVVYLGADPDETKLWTPTRLGPDRPAALVLRSICKDLGLEGTVAVWPGLSMALPVSRARALDARALAAWIQR